jgi:hypothetical protein
LDAASTDWARSVTVEIIGAGSYVPPGSRRSASTDDNTVPTRPAAAAAQHVEDIVSLMNEPEPALADVATNYVPEVEDTEDEEEAAALIDMPAPEPIAAVATPIVVPTPVMFDPETKAAVGRALRTVPFAAVAAPEPVKPKSRPKPVFTSDENVGTVIKRKKKTEKRKTKAQLKQEEKKKQGGFFGFFGKTKEDDDAAAMDKSMPTLDIGAIDVDLGNKAEYQGMALTRPPHRRVRHRRRHPSLHRRRSRSPDGSRPRGRARRRPHRTAATSTGTSTPDPPSSSATTAPPPATWLSSTWCPTSPSASTSCWLATSPSWAAGRWTSAVA